MTRFIILLGLLTLSSNAISDPNDPVKVIARWKSDDAQSITLEVKLDIEEVGFRVYKDSLKVSATGLKVLDNPLPVGKAKLDPFTKKEKEVYTGSTSWDVKLSRSGQNEVEVAVGYRACNDVTCHFPKTKRLKVANDKKEIRAEVGGIAGFWSLLTSVNAEQIKELASQHMWLALLVCFFSGILTSLTPCVYPMIPITINIFGRASQKDAAETGSQKKFNTKTFGLACVYVAGMCVTYSLMGLVAGLTGSLFGKVLQSSYMLGFLTLLFFILAMGQLGFFKMALPSAWQTKIATFGSADNLFGIFLMGLFSGLIVSPCVGPVIAGILAFVFDSSNAFVGLVYFFSFSLGLGVLFLLIGGFSGILATLPRSGAWMLRINRLLAGLMLVAAGYYGLLLAKQTGLIKRPEASLVQNGGNSWHTDEAAALRLASEKGLPVFVDFTAEWCAACHEIDAKIFKDPAVAEKMKNFVLLRIDVTAETAENEEKLKKYSVFSLPAIVFVNREGKTLDKPRIHGLIPVDKFLAALNEVP